MKLRCQAGGDGTARDCVILSEQPPARGFGSAALGMAPRLRLKSPANGGPKKGDVFTMPVGFDLSVEEAGQQRITPSDAPPLVEGLEWASRPSGADLARLYPDRAREGGVSGQANVLCTVRANGSLDGCRSLFEAPAGYGFGEATRLLAQRRFRLHPVGETEAGKAVWVSMVWRLGS
ncbi:MAG: energy transducer TonB [Proteobacteria bacterium]|nr:energy transducer TonB [Pseudomonadota bacterium]